MYIYSSTLARKLLNSFGLCSSLLEQIDLGSINRVDETGSAIRYTTEELNWQLVKSYLSDKELKINGYFEKEDFWSRIIHSWYLTRLRHKTELYFLMRNFVNSMLVQKKVTIYLDTFPIFKIWLSNMPKVKHLTVSRTINLMEVFLPFLLVAKAIFDLLLGYTHLFPQSTNIGANDKRSKIFALYISNIFSRYPHAGHLFWYPSTGLDGGRVVLYFERKDDKFSEDNVKIIEKHKFPWVNLNGRFRSKVSIINLLKMFLRVKMQGTLKGNGLTLYLIQLYLVFVVEWYRSIIKKYNVKVVHQHQECWPLPLCLALAVKKEEGIFIWNHWSVDHYPISYFNVGFADLVFSWGDYNDGYFNCHNYKYDYMVQTGLICGENILPADIRSAQNIRKNFPSEVTSVFTILDSSHGHTSVDSTTNEVLLFYKWIFKYIRNQSDYGIIIQSKGAAFEKIKQDELISSDLNQLMSCGRCIVSTKYSRMVPSCFAADLSICFTINSAGFIAGLAGRRAIYWDVSGELSHPLYKLKVDKNIIFKRLKDIEKELEKFRTDKSDLGDHSKWISIIDPFRDGQGPKRAGEVIEAFMNAMDKGESRNVALRRAVEMYKLKWGDDKVTSYRKIIENEGDKVWRKVKIDTSNRLQNVIKKF